MLKSNNKNFSCFVKLLDVVFIMLINAKMPTRVGFLTFMSMINFMLSWEEPGKSQISLFSYREYVYVVLIKK